MRLSRLRVRGLRSFARETEIDLARLGEEGLFAICGPTGAGKSTVLDGIFLALFGRSPRGEPSECVSAGATELSVRLELVLRGDEAREVAVERRFRWGRKRSSAKDAAGADLRGASKHPPLRLEVKKDGVWEPADLKGKRADEYLHDEVVRVSMRDFQQAVVLPQGQFDALLRARPTERRALVASLFRTEHLGQPLAEVLKAREGAVRGEMSGLEEAEREVLVSDAEAAEAAELAVTSAADANARAAELLRAEAHAASQRLARQRCAARDAAARAFAEQDRAFEERASDRERASRGRRAASAHAAIAELDAAEVDVAESERKATIADADLRACEARRRLAATALSQAATERATSLPETLERLGRARLALARGEDLAALDGDREARAGELASAYRELRAAREARARARASVDAAEAAARERSAQLALARVGEDERAWAIAVAVLAERAEAEARVTDVAAAEVASVEARVRSLETAHAAAEAEAREALVVAVAHEAERRQKEFDAQRAGLEAEAAENDLTRARRDAAAAELASALVPGDACPVCGSREHPGGAHQAKALTIAMAERAVAATKRAVKAAEQALADATRAAADKAEAARMLEGREDTATADLDGARRLLARLVSGEEVPRSVLEARATVERLGVRADVAMAAVAPERRGEARDTGAREPRGVAEARLAELARRGRAAEDLEREATRAAAGLETARAELVARQGIVEGAERGRTIAEARAEAAASLARARRDEIATLLADLEPRGQRSLFDRPKTRTAEEWVDELSAKADRLARAEDEARAAFDEARAEVERLALDAREAAVRRREAKGRHTRARAAAQAATSGAGFADLASLREAQVDPAELDALELGLDRLAAARREASAVLAERQRDATVEVTEAEAALAEAARDRARTVAEAARERAGQAAARGEELARRRVRAAELRAKIDALAPRARRLAQIRQVVSSGQLSELAAERHLEAVTAGATALLGTLSSSRYALVRDPQGAFAVTDAAYGGLVRAPSTLSGGETFLVSLALALSLSERIQLAGRTRFDFFFLDEGFGSLDAGTLEIALGALEQLRGPNRVIGMISHVPAIEERMPRRLRVSSERRGGATSVAYEP